MGFFGDRVSQNTCPGWLWTVILLISASWVAMMPQVPGSLFCTNAALFYIKTISLDNNNMNCFHIEYVIYPSHPSMTTKHHGGIPDSRSLLKWLIKVSLLSFVVNYYYWYFTDKETRKQRMTEMTLIRGRG
jgi:hypothetical protein